MKKILGLVLTICALFSVTAVAQDHHDYYYKNYRYHHNYRTHTAPSRDYEIDNGRNVPLAGYWLGHPYYGGLRIYDDVNIYPCSPWAFENGYCYPYDYYYYPEVYYRFHLGFNLR